MRFGTMIVKCDECGREAYMDLDLSAQPLLPEDWGVDEDGPTDLDICPDCQ